MKVCRTCEVPKPLDDYYKNESGNHYPDCKKCRNKKGVSRRNASVRRRAYTKKGHFDTAKVACYNAPECSSIITVEIVDGEKPPIKICGECKKSGRPAEREVYAKTIGAFSDDLEIIHREKFTSAVKRLSKKEIARIKDQITPLHPDLRVV